MVKSTDKCDGFTMDFWGKGATSNMTSKQPHRVKGQSKRGFRKSHGKFRWYLVIGISVLVTLVTVVVIAVAVHYTRSNTNPESLKTAPRVKEDPGFTPHVLPSGPGKNTTSENAQHSTSSTISSTTSLSHTETSPSLIHVPAQMVTSPSMLTDDIATHQSSTLPTSISSNNNQWSTASDVTTDPRATTPVPPSAMSPSTPMLTFVASNLSFDKKRLTLTCEAVYMAGWSELHIIRHYKDLHETVGMVTAGHQFPSVTVLDPNFSSQISYKYDAIAFVLESDIPYCAAFRNFTCVVRALPGTFTAGKEIKVKQNAPTVVAPRSVVAGTNITLVCSAHIHGVNGSVRWKVRPPGTQTFYYLSTTPMTSQAFSNCSKSINSTIVFLPKETDNGSHFRCVIEGADGAMEEAAYPKTDVEFNVIPESFCADKRLYTVHAHPYSPCTLVVYCFQTGPLVYEINCDPGTCYDKYKTSCV